MSIRSYGRSRPPAYKEPADYRIGEIILMVIACGALASAAFLLFRAFAG